MGEVALEIKNLNAHDHVSGRDILKNINLNVRKGEVVGVAGLIGAGRTELAYSIFGNPRDYSISGEIYMEGKPVNFNHSGDAIKAGLAYVTEDRKREGLILIQDVKNNISLANLKALSNRGVVNENKEITVATHYKDSLTIKTPSIQQIIGNLSGGNQQKVSVGKWLFTEPKVLILDEPTRGIDVGAKFEIYTIINKLIEQGMSIIMISSELPEVMGMSDRIYVMSEGQITGEMDAADATQDKIMEMATVS